MTNEFDFDNLEEIEIPVKVGGKEYTLREASEDAVCKYQNRLMACTELGEEGKPTRIRGMADVQPLLVSLCLFNADNNQPVSEKTVRKWRSRIVKPLFKKAKEISEIDEEETEEVLLEQKADIEKKIEALENDAAKNESSDGETISQ